ncbi:DUF3261 domain-containing protein [Vibrio sp. RC27]
MKNRIVSSILVGLLLGLAGCSSSQSTFNQTLSSDTTTEDKLVLLSPESYHGELITQQLMDVEYDGQQHRLRMILEVNPSGVTLVALTGFSLPAFTLSWNGEVLDLDSKLPIEAKGIDAQRIMQDIMLALWPSSSLDPLLSSKGWTLILNEDVRQFVDGDQNQTMTIEYKDHRNQNGIIDVYHHGANIGYQLTTLQWESRYE